MEEVMFESSMFATNSVRKSFLPTVVFAVMVALATVGIIVWAASGGSL
jgi:hypothetical protein